MTLVLYLDQNYLSGIAKRKPMFVELEPILRQATETGAVTVLESAVHQRESAPRPDLQLLQLLHELSNGQKLPAQADGAARETRRRLTWVIEHELPERRARPSDRADLDALAQALAHCDLVTTDAFMADVIKRARLDLRHQADVFSGRRADVVRLTDRLRTLIAGDNQLPVAKDPEVPHDGRRQRAPRDRQGTGRRRQGHPRRRRERRDDQEALRLDRRRVD